VDRTNRVAREMVRLVDQHKETGSWHHVELEVIHPAGTGDRDLDPLKRRVREGVFFGMADIPAGAVNGDETCVLYVRGTGSDNRVREVRQLINEAAKRIRFALEFGISSSFYPLIWFHQ